MGKIIDLTGQRFGRLTAIEYVGKNENNLAMWKCKCDCGNEIIANGKTLRNGGRRSCGCLLAKHGLSHDKVYKVLINIKSRCANENNPTYKYYGLRGIGICEEWADKEHGYENFVKWALENGYEDGLTIDRIDVNKGYEPSNCRWVDRSVQGFNRRITPSKLGVRGVRFDNRYNSYSASIMKNQKYIYLGSFKTIEDAIKARKEAEMQYFGQVLD